MKKLYSTEFNIGRSGEDVNVNELPEKDEGVSIYRGCYLHNASKQCPAVWVAPISTPWEIYIIDYNKEYDITSIYEYIEEAFEAAQQITKEGIGIHEIKELSARMAVNISKRGSAEWDY